MIEIILYSMAAVVIIIIVTYYFVPGSRELTIKVYKILEMSVKPGKKETNQTLRLDLPESGSQPAVSKTIRDSQAHLELTRISEMCLKTKGMHHISIGTDENMRVVTHIFGASSRTIVGTIFFEKPYYGASDLARTIPEGVTYYRITSEEVCDDKTQRDIKELFDSVRCKAILVILPRNLKVTRIQGLFASFTDGSHLALQSLQSNPNHHYENTSIVYCGDFAKVLFEYYKGIALDKIRKS